MAHSTVNWSNVMDRLFEDLHNKKPMKELLDVLKRFANALNNVKIETVEAALAEGLFVGAMKNAAEYVVKVGGRSSNIVNVFDKTAVSSLGNPKWFARVDMPHRNVPFHHINVNPAITGFPDPHIRISPGAAQAAGVAGEVLSFLNKITPYLSVVLIVFEIYDIGKNILKDYTNGSFRNTITKLLTLLITVLAGFGGATGGGAIGSWIFPGIGTLIGALIGGLIGGVAGAVGTTEGLNALFDYFEFDIEKLVCQKCDKPFVNRRYEEGRQEFCTNCRN